MKWALNEVHRELRKFPHAHLVLTVHDNLMIDCTVHEVDELCESVPDWMTYGPVGEVVPIRPEPEVSYGTWADLEKWRKAA